MTLSIPSPERTKEHMHAHLYRERQSAISSLVYYPVYTMMYHLRVILLCCCAIIVYKYSSTRYSLLLARSSIHTCDIIYLCLCSSCDVTGVHLPLQVSQHACPKYPTWALKRPKWVECTWRSKHKKHKRPTISPSCPTYIYIQPDPFTTSRYSYYGNRCFGLPQNRRKSYSYIQNERSVRFLYMWSRGAFVKEFLSQKHKNTREKKHDTQCFSYKSLKGHTSSCVRPKTCAPWCA